MKRIVVDATAIGGFLSVGLAAALVLRPGDWQLALDAWFLALGGVVLAAAVAATRSADPRSPSSRRRRQRAEPAERLPELAQVERVVEMGGGTAFDAHYRLRPVFREVAEHRLAARRGLTLDSGSAAVRAALGDSLWELVRPDREPPRFRHDQGVPLADIRAAVEALERI